MVLYSFEKELGEKDLKQISDDLVETIQKIVDDFK